MSAPSSTPSLPLDEDNWMDFTSSLITSLPTLQSSSGSTEPSPSNPSSLHSFGKFNSFSFVGASISGGGTRRGLLITQQRSKFERLCLGLVGLNKFCTKERLAGSNSCGTVKHETSKFEASPNCCFVKFNEIQAHSSPTLSVEGFTSEQVQSLGDRMLTITDWTSIFDEIASGSLPNWFPQAPWPTHHDNQNHSILQPLSIMSPTGGPARLFDFHPTLSFDSSDSSIIDKAGTELLPWRAHVVPPELLAHIDHVSPNVKKIKSAWSKPFCDIEASYKLVVANLCTMINNIVTMHSHLGDPPSQDHGHTIWKALEHLQEAYNDLESSTTDLEAKLVVSINEYISNLGIPADLVFIVDSMQQTQRQQETRMTQTEDLLHVHFTRFTNIRPVLERITTMKTPNVALTVAPVSDPLVRDLQARLTTLEHQVSTNGMETLYVESLSTLWPFIVGLLFFCWFLRHRIRRQQLSQLLQIRFQVYVGNKGRSVNAELLPSPFRKGGRREDQR